jgi:hypothetical protein
VEKRNVFLPRFDTVTDGQTSQGIHDLGDIDVVGTSDATRIAGGTDPDGFGRENLVPMVILDMTKDLIREDIHGVSDRTPGRTLLTLIAGFYFFATSLNHLR